jgi:hypothetical protein
MAGSEEIPIVANILNAGPEMLGITVSSAGVPGEWVDPGCEFEVRVEVRDRNTLEDIRGLRVVLYAPSSSEGDGDGASDHYTFGWSRADGFENPGGVGAVLEDMSSAPPDMTRGIGYWTFRARLERAALYSSGWTAVCSATDEEESARVETGFRVSQYGSLYLGSSTLSFSGQPGTLVSAEQNPIELRYTCNYRAKIRCWATEFTGVENGGMVLGPSSFSVDDDDDPGGHEEGSSFLTLRSQRQVFAEGLGPGEDSSMSVYLYVSIPDPFYDQDYSGNIYFDMGS